MHAINCKSLGRSTVRVLTLKVLGSIPGDAFFFLLLFFSPPFFSPPFLSLLPFYSPLHARSATSMFQHYPSYVAGEHDMVPIASISNRSNIASFTLSIVAKQLGQQKYWACLIVLFSGTKQLL